MSEWDVHLELVDDKSSKFWRAKVDGADVHVNYGRIGARGQTKVKTFASVDKARSELDKVAMQKRRKGYVDAAAIDRDAPATEATPSAGRFAEMTLTRDGRPVRLTLHVDGVVLRTELEETHADPAAAIAAYERIVDALEREGYQRV